jgi:hypothetical protein
VFSVFGTSVPVLHQEDHGIDLLCSLTERKGRRAWPVAYYSVQVKSTGDPWLFEGADSAIRGICSRTGDYTALRAPGGSAAQAVRATLRDEQFPSTSAWSSTRHEERFGLSTAPRLRCLIADREGGKPLTVLP